MTGGMTAGMTATAATIVCALSCGVLVAASGLGAARLRTAAKLVASAGFIAVGASVYRGDAFGCWIITGLVLGAIGDAFLLGHGRAMFLGGMIAFLLGHLAYLAGLALLVPPGAWLGTAGALAAAPIAIGIMMLAGLWPRLGGLKLPVSLYVAALVTVVVAAFAVYRAGALPAPQQSWLAAGAGLFFFSDLWVARERFLTRSFVNKLWGLPAYYAGQLLIAWSIS
jgi:uncharacterized membrane protein YhhN